MSFVATDSGLYLKWVLLNKSIQILKTIDEKLSKSKQDDLTIFVKNQYESLSQYKESIKDQASKFKMCSQDHLASDIKEVLTQIDQTLSSSFPHRALAVPAALYSKNLLDCGYGKKELLMVAKEGMKDDIIFYYQMFVNLVDTNILSGLQELPTSKR